MMKPKASLCSIYVYPKMKFFYNKQKILIKVLTPIKTISPLWEYVVSFSQSWTYKIRFVDLTLCRTCWRERLQLDQTTWSPRPTHFPPNKSFSTLHPTSVADTDPNPDPDPSDPYDFGPPWSRSGSISQRYGSWSGSGSGSFYPHAK